MIHTPEERFLQMTQEPVPKLVTSLAGPSIVSMLVSSLYNMADTYFVGKIDTQSIAAVGVVFSVMAVIQAFGYFFGHGSGNFISRRLGAQDTAQAERMAATGFGCAFLTGTLFTVLGLIFLTPLSRLIGSTPTILPYTEKYLRIILLGAPFMMSSLALNNQIRFQGNALYGMYGIVTGTIINIILDPILIFACDLGIAGAALATVISQICSLIILLRMAHHGGNIPINLRKFTPKPAFLREIIGGGSPSLVRQGMHSVSSILLNTAAGVYGDAAIAGMSVVMRILGFINSFYIGFGQGFQPVCGFNYGAGLYGRVRKGFWFCVRVGLLFLTIVAILGYGYAEEAVGFFRKEDPMVILVGAAALRWQLLTLPLNSFITISNMYLQTIRKPIHATLLASARQGIFFIPLILILPRLYGLTGVEICQSVCDVLTFLLALPLTLSTLRSMGKERIE